jgi:transcriptional regulator
MKWPKEMGRTVNYDFTIDSLVSVEAPIGTDPDDLVDMVLQKLIERAKEKDVSVMFDTCFDSDSGDYWEDWENKNGN